MSDDDHDDDSRSGGLWDPDAYTPPPARGRPTLRVIESNDQDNRSTSHGLTERTGEALVRLDQFRPADPDEANLDRHRRHRRAAALAAAVVLIAAVTVTAIRITADGADHAPPTTTAGTLSTDSEQAALARKVAPHPPATKHRRPGHRASDAKHRSSPPAGRSIATQARSAPRPATPLQPSRSTPVTKPKKKLRQYDAISSDATPQLYQPVAASEFGFEN